MRSETVPTVSQRDNVLAELDRRAFLFDSPGDYRAGVRDTLARISLEQEQTEQVARSDAHPHAKQERARG